MVVPATSTFLILFTYLFIFWLTWDLLVNMADGVWDSAQCKPSGEAWGPQLGIYFTPQPSGMSCFSATTASNSSALSSEALLFWDVDLLVARDLALGSTQNLSHMFLTPQLGADGPNDLLKSHALGLSSGTYIQSCLESRLGITLRWDPCLCSRQLSRVP